jgi:CubicO group peptidase (beta-lactamase class C family)
MRTAPAHTSTRSSNARRLPIALALASALCATTHIALAQSETIEEARALRLVAAIGSGDAAQLLEAIQTEFAPSLLERRPDGWKGLAEMLASHHSGMEVVAIEVPEPHRMEVLTRDPGATWRIELTFESTPPHRIAGFGISSDDESDERGPELPPLELPSGNAEAIAPAIQRWFDKLHEDLEFSGAVLVAVRGSTLLRGAWGLADRRWQVPNHVDTRFDLGSINKSFTRVAIGRLLAAGKLALDDTIADQLPDYPNAEAAGRITIEQLLEHSSGLPDVFGPAFFDSSKALYRGPHDFFPLFVQEPLLFEPGAGRQYSNAGFMVLGAIIEAVTGKPYPEVIQEWVFSPAGMMDSGFFAHDDPVPNVAEGYTRDRETGRVTSNVLMLPVVGNSAGSAYSTVDDLARFDAALREHRLLPPGWTAWHFGAAPPEPGSAGEIGDEAPRDATGIGIAGGAPGVNAVLESGPDAVIVVLANSDPPVAEASGMRIVRALRAALLGETPPTGPAQPPGTERPTRPSGR